MTGAVYAFGEGDDDERWSFVDLTEAAELIVRGDALMTNLRAFIRLDDRNDQALRDELRTQGEKFVAQLLAVMS